jgi:hypothetical protein
MNRLAEPISLVKHLERCNAAWGSSWTYASPTASWISMPLQLEGARPHFDASGRDVGLTFTSRGGGFSIPPPGGCPSCCLTSLCQPHQAAPPTGCWEPRSILGLEADHLLLSRDSSTSD